MNINTKISSIANNNPARPSRFKVRIFGPSGLTVPSILIENSVEKIEIPQIGVSNIDYNLDQSLNIQVPFKRVPQGTINITFQLDENHVIRNFIEDWMKYLVTGRNNTPTYFASEYYQNSIGTIVVQQLTPATSSVFDLGVKSIMFFEGAYPAQTQPYVYDWGERDSYVQYVVTFNYYNIL